MMREERLKDLVSPEAEKITAIQINTGSQYLPNERNGITRAANKVDRRGANLIVDGANGAYVPATAEIEGGLSPC